MIKNTSYKVQSDVNTEGERLYYQIEEGAYVTTSAGVWTVWNGEWRKIYPQAGVATGIGWARYMDSQYTEASPLSLADGVSTLLSNNKATVIRSDSSVEYYENGVNQKIIGDHLNDVYIITIEFKAQAVNANQTHLDLSIQNGGGVIENIDIALAFIKGNATTQIFHNIFQYYIDQSFLDNGASVYVESNGGTSTVWDIEYFIQKTQSYA
jgi:hypothetical protein